MVLSLDGVLSYLETTVKRSLFSSRRHLPVACCLLALLAGCPSSEPPKAVRSASLLRLVVVDDPALAAAIGRLRGEWSGLWGSDLEVEQMSGDDLTNADQILADAIICPSHQLGFLAEKKRLVPVPHALLTGDEEDSQIDAAQWSEIFSLLRAREAVWGTDILAVPFGSPVLTCYYRADLLKKLDRKPPQSWAEYQELAELLAELGSSGETTGGDCPDFRGAKMGLSPSPDSPWYGAIEPLGPGWAGQVLLARAAAYASHQENYSSLFNFSTMDPLIDGPAFIRALEELVAVAAAGPADMLTYDLAAVRRAFWEGRCGLSLSWPTAADTDSSPTADAVEVGFAELPGAADVYNFVDQQWETRRPDEDQHVPLLGVAGRIGVVTSQSRWPKEAFELLFWLSGEQFRQASAASPATTLFHQSHLSSAKSWVEKQIPAAQAAQYAALTQQTLSRGQRMFALRIPGRSEYLAALDEAVHRAVRGEQPPSESLAKAAAQWQEITQRLGRDQQSEAYYHSLGLD